MSTWHTDEPLHEAMTLFFCAFPDEGKAGGAARIALSVGPQDWTAALRRIALREVSESGK